MGYAPSAKHLAFTGVIALLTACCGLGILGCGDDSSPADGGPPDAGVLLPSACATPPVMVPGEACLADGHCVGDSVCRIDDRDGIGDLTPVSLACAPPSSGARAGEPCAESRECARGLCLVAGSCALPCGTTSDCEAGQRCAATWTQTGPESMQRLFSCVAQTSLPDEVTVMRTVLDVAGGEGEMRFDPLSVGALAVLRPGCDLSMAPVSLVGAGAGDPTVWSDDRSGEPWANPVHVFGRSTTLVFPSGAPGTVSTSGHRLHVVFTGAGSVTRTTVERVGTGGVLDFDVFYVGGGGWGPAGERGPPALAAAFDTLAASFARAGIDLGEVRQHQLVGGLRERYGIVDRTREGHYPEMDELVSLAAGAPGPSVPLFMVRAVDGALGLSGGVPGPAGHHGLEGAGVLLGVDVIGTDSALALALSHEVGHYLGLFHTTESDGRLVESLSDTPACRRDRDADGNGTLDFFECAGAGGDNLMFWSADGDALSDGQLLILSRSPLLSGP